jgi:cation diffusion facilitator family transporter
MHSKEEKEKNSVAMSSLWAAIFLTAFKLIVGLSTNSLGILSEAAHSGLDLVAAFITFMAVRIASIPADKDHNFGHGKTENISALFETILLLITCIWIVYESVERLTGKTHPVVSVNFWSYAVIVVAIVVDISRSRMLKKAAKKFHSQALEADALHFSSDILSSGVVLLGLITFSFGYTVADSIAALAVAVIVIFISLRLGKKSIDDLIDKAPDGIDEKIGWIIAEIPEVIKVHDIKARNSGSLILIEMNIHVDPRLSVEQAHAISEKVEKKICDSIERCEAHIHIEPEEN